MSDRAMTTKSRGVGRLTRVRDTFQARESALRRRFWQYRHNRKGATRAGFLVGCGRSGTTMLVRHLGRSWEVTAYNENAPAAFDKWRLRPLPEIGALVEAGHARVSLFKPILNTTQTTAFLDVFPDARVVFVYRHFDDVINSSLKKFGRENRINHVRRWMTDDFAEFHYAPPPESTRAFIRELWRPDLSPASGAALYWLFYNRLYFDLGLPAEPRACLAGYERLVNAPEATMRALCNHLGITYEPRLAEGIFASSVGRDEARDLAPDIRAACESLYLALEAAVVEPAFREATR